MPNKVHAAASVLRFQPSWAGQLEIGSGLTGEKQATVETIEKSFIICLRKICAAAPDEVALPAWNGRASQLRVVWLCHGRHM